MVDPVLTAEAWIGVPARFARTWFLELQDHPERYAFDSHEGFTFTEGAFGEVGARFQTRERFAGVLKLTLRFRLVEVVDARFVFEVLGPTRGVWGYFELAPADCSTTLLRLAVGSDQVGKRRLLAFPPVRNAIRRQIQGEVDHIATSMVSLHRSREA